MVEEGKWEQEEDGDWQDDFLEEEDDEEELDHDRLFLIFECGNTRFAIKAGDVHNVLPWTDPLPLPGSGSMVRGVVQDRGRVVAVLWHPTGTRAESALEFSRILVCPTPQGAIGIPATRTLTVDLLSAEMTAGSNTISGHSLGALTRVEALELAGRVVDSASSVATGA